MYFLPHIRSKTRFYLNSHDGPCDFAQQGVEFLNKARSLSTIGKEFRKLKFQQAATVACHPKQLRMASSSTSTESSGSHHGKTPNKLIESKSPYLLQHAYNPVDWY